MGIRDEKKSLSRRRLLQAAYELFSQQGYEQTRVEEVAAAAGVSRATLFNYFPSKAALIFTDGEQIMAAGLAAIASRAADDGAADALAAAFIAMIDSTVGTDRDPDGGLEAMRIRLILTTPQLRAELVERSLATTQTLAAALQANHPELDMVTARAMVGAVAGAALAAGSGEDPSGVPSRRMLIRSVSLVTDGLRASRPIA